jgi:hypothetical protein
MTALDLQPRGRVGSALDPTLELALRAQQRFSRSLASLGAGQQ